MTWTYGGTPGTATAAERRDAVRLLIGDTDTNDQQVPDEEITFALAQASDDVYGAAAVMARTLAAKYARLVDVSFDSVRTAYSQRREQYLVLAQQMEVEAKKRGLGGLGLPGAGGISIDTIEGVRQQTDRPSSAFRMGMFDNPPGVPGSDDDYEWDR